MSSILRSFKNVTKGYSSVQIKVRDATSNDPWGPSQTAMTEIAQLTFNSGNEFFEIMDMLDKRLNDKGKNWRQVFKSLKVVDYILHEGSDLVVTWAQKNIYTFKTLREFQHMDEDQRDVGHNVRVSAKALTSLILDEERLRAERSEEYQSHDPPRRSRPQLAQRANEEDRRKRQGDPEDEVRAMGTIPPEYLLNSLPRVVPLGQPAQHRDQDENTNGTSSTAAAPKERPHIERALTDAGVYDDPILKNLTEMGYGRADALAALERYDYNLELAATYLARPANGLSDSAQSIGGNYAKVWKELDESLPEVHHDDKRGTFPDDAEKLPHEARDPSSPPHELPIPYAPTGTGGAGSIQQLPYASQKGSGKVEAAPDVDPSDVPLRLQMTQSTESSPSIFTTTDVKLGDYFKHGKDPPKPFTDIQCTEISRLLVQSEKLSWSAAPRIYIVLRLIGQLHHFDAFLDHSINDLWLPFSAASLPRSLDLAYHDEFLKRQTLVLTKAINLENGSRGHAHFTKNDPFPFEVKETLGEGGFGYVDKIVSPISGRVFARKRFRRPRGQKKTELESFMNELKILKRLHHIHCVSLVASYTDPKYFGIIIAPVADCDLAAFYPTVKAETTPVLRSFFGCLANAVNFLHDAKIRHRDIKPQNILVKGSSIYLTDFGISLDWENLSRSTTTKDTAKSMLYCAPEVARYEKRNTSADIWSLGCVFLEMLTIIKGKTLEEQRSLFKGRSGNYRFYDNNSAARDWIEQLRGLQPENGSDQLVADIILEMLQETADDRIPAIALSNKFSSYQTPDSTKSNPVCGECCISDTLSISDSGSDRDPFEDTS